MMKHPFSNKSPTAPSTKHNMSPPPPTAQQNRRNTVYRYVFFIAMMPGFELSPILGNCVLSTILQRE